MMKAFNIGILFCMGISYTGLAQNYWDLNGTRIMNNNTGGVSVRQDAPTASSIPSWGNWAFFSWGSASHTSGTASKVWGAYLLSLNNNSGTLTESIGAYVTAGNESSGPGTTTNAYGLYSKIQSGQGTVVNGYGVYIGAVAANNDFGLYQAGSDDNNYFAGKVGIGTLNPTALLTVNGKIEAEEIEVKNVGADFVFESDYKLRSLDEVKTFIYENKHLPDIAPASVTEQGVELGEFSEKLLQKIEELTLYVIELKEENDRQQKEITKLKQ